MKKIFLYTGAFLENLFEAIFVPRTRGHGNFIIIDGGEGAGKGTIVERLKQKYPHVTFSREPGGTEYAEEMREVMLKSPHAKSASARTLFLLVSAGRSDHMHRKAEKIVVSGEHFVSDRGDITSWGYQVGGQEGGYAMAKLFFQVRKSVYASIRPDLYIVLEVDPIEGARRVAARKGEVNHFDERKHDFHERVMKAYRTFGKLFPMRVKFVDANPSRDEVFASVDAIIAPFLIKSS